MKIKSNTFARSNREREKIMTPKLFHIIDAEHVENIINDQCDSVYIIGIHTPP